MINAVHYKNNEVRLLSDISNIDKVWILSCHKYISHTYNYLLFYVSQLSISEYLFFILSTALCDITQFNFFWAQMTIGAFMILHTKNKLHIVIFSG